ncbi:MAG: permease-like cell division protein FtsX [Anaerovoracaceae bacterium]
MMNQLLYNIKQAFTQINRNKGMSATSIFAITAMMLILGLFFVITVNVNLFTEVVKQDYDLVEIYLKDSTNTAQSDEIMAQLKNLKGVKEVEYRDKAEALDIMKVRWGDSGYLLDSLGNNPLPNSVLVTVSDLESATSVTTQASKLDGIENVKYYQETVEKLTKATDFLQLAALIIMGFLVVVSVVVVANTIKLTVFNRSREISIMKYIGATNWFIRGPFLAEGVIIGVFSSLISVGITALVYGKIVQVIGTDIMSIISSPLVPVGYLAGNLVCIFLAIGVSIGACGSIVSMRKFLDT